MNEPTPEHNREFQDLTETLRVREEEAQSKEGVQKIDISMTTSLSLSLSVTYIEDFIRVKKSTKRKE